MIFEYAIERRRAVAEIELLRQSRLDLCRKGRSLPFLGAGRPGAHQTRHADDQAEQKIDDVAMAKRTDPMTRAFYG